MEITPEISIIVPIYKIEPYLRKCVDSIVNQTYKNLEIILVDDGSPDGCPQICDEYKEKDERVVVIHKPNGGLSDARNAGLDAATGDYITFIDGDDWYEKDAIETLVALALKTGAAVSCMRNAVVSTDYMTTEQVTDDRSTKVLSSHQLLKLLCEKKYSTSVCNKLFDASIWESKRFNKGRLNEDYLALCEILMDEFTVAKIEYPGYYYYTRPESITHSESDKAKPVHDALLNAMELKHEAEQKRPELSKYFARMALYQARTMLFVMPTDVWKEQTSQRIALEDCLNECGKYLLTSNLSVTDKIILACSRISIATTAESIKKVYSWKAFYNE